MQRARGRARERERERERERQRERQSECCTGREVQGTMHSLGVAGTVDPRAHAQWIAHPRRPQVVELCRRLRPPCAAPMA
jgi:hypothetical protein